MSRASSLLAALQIPLDFSARRPATNPGPVRYTIASLFSGAGCWELGALEAGADALWGVELLPEVTEVLGQNLHAMGQPQYRAINADVVSVDVSTLEPPDLLAVSPPCTRHTKAWKGRSKEGVGPDERRSCPEVGVATLRYVQTLRPSAVLVENVVEYLSSEPFLELEHGLRSLGYSGYHATIRAEDFGSPTMRHRMIGVYVAHGHAPQPVRSTPLSWWEAVQDIAHDFDPSALQPWQKDRIERMREHGLLPRLPWMVSGTNVSTPRFRRGGVVAIVRGPDMPGWTIAATPTGMAATRVVLADGSVMAPSLRAYYRWMGFPDRYTPSAAVLTAREMAGNAIPVPLARAIVSAVTDDLAAKAVLPKRAGRG